LRPDTPPEGEDRKQRPGEAPGELSPHLQAIAQDAGLTDMQRPDRRPNSLKALQAIEFAKGQNKGEEMRDALYSAYWEQKRDVGEWDVLQDLAESVGLVWAELKLVLETNLYLDTVMEDFQDGMDNGFNGIPAFIIGDVKFTGAQPMEVFRKVADRAVALLEEDPKAFEKIRRVL
jgi:predicted DsbA family dithiol-disulfide isomerase